jgi:hypothetical protein
MSDEPSFLSRWSRLKRRVTLERDTPPKAAAVAAPPAAPEAGPPPLEKAYQAPPVAATDPASAGKAPDDEEPVDVSKLPPIDSLGKDSDYSIFMRKGVPEDLRMKALRRMWLTDPVLAGPEVLDMYAFDYTGVDGHKPLVRPAMEAVAAVAKAVNEATAKSAPGHSQAADQDASPSGATQQPASEDEPREESTSRRG